LPKRKSKAAAPAAGQQQQKLASKGAANAAPGAVDGNGSAAAAGGDVDAASAPASNTADDGTPAELSAAIAAWQQFEEQAKALLVGRKQADNMVQLLLSQVEGKQPEQVTMEVDVALIAFFRCWLAFSLSASPAMKLFFCSIVFCCSTGGIAACLLLIALEGCPW